MAKKISRLVRLFPLCAFFVMLATASNLVAADCDRACPKTLLDQYLNAMIKHDPAAAPLFVGFRQTENAVVIRPGDGVGKTLTGLGKVQRRYFDAVTTPPAVSGCTSGLANIKILDVAARRYPLIDEEAGEVLGMVLFQRNHGTTTRRKFLTEWFYLEDSKIKAIYAAMFYPPPEAPAPNWPPYDPNWPIQRPPAAAPAGQR